jgi:hypothetical protein
MPAHRPAWRQRPITQQKQSRALAKTAVFDIAFTDRLPPFSNGRSRRLAQKIRAKTGQKAEN